MELKTTDKTEDEGALQKAADFVQAFLLGFEVQDAVALLRLDDLYLECFEAGPEACTLCTVLPFKLDLTDFGASLPLVLLSTLLCGFGSKANGASLYAAASLSICVYVLLFGVRRFGCPLMYASIIYIMC